MRPTRRFILGPVLWLCCFQFFVAEQIVRIGWNLHSPAPAYSMSLNYISDLGAIHCTPYPTGLVCSPWHALMNASLVLQSILIFFGALFLRRYLPRRRISNSTRAAFMLGAIGVLIVALNPEDGNSLLHFRGATVDFLFTNLGMLLTAATLYTAASGTLARRWAWFSLVAGIVGLGTTILLGFRSAPAYIALGWPIGTVERVAAYPLPVWLTATGLLLLIRPAAFNADALPTA